MTEFDPAPAAAPAGTEAASRPEGGGRRMLVMFSIAMAILLFLATQALLYHRWSSMNVPSCVLVVQTDPSQRGAEVVVDSVTLPRSLKTTVGKNDRFDLPFFVDPGTYTITLIINDDVRDKRQVTFARPREGLAVSFKGLGPATLPTTHP